MNISNFPNPAQSNEELSFVTLTDSFAGTPESVFFAEINPCGFEGFIPEGTDLVVMNGYRHLTSITINFDEINFYLDPELNSKFGFWCDDESTVEAVEGMGI